MPSRVWVVMTTLEKYKGQRVYDTPLRVFSNVRSVYSVVIQSTLSSNLKMKDSTSSRRIQGERRTEAELKVMSNTPEVLPPAADLGVVVIEVLAPCYLGGVPLPSAAPLLSQHIHCGLKPSCGLPLDQANVQWMAEEANLIH